MCIRDRNVTLDKSNGNPAMTQGNAACYAQDLSGAIYAVYSDAGLTNEVGRITTDANGHGELNGITVQRNAVLYTKELVAPRGFGLDAQVYSHMFTANGCLLYTSIICPTNISEKTLKGVMNTRGVCVQALDALPFSKPLNFKIVLTMMTRNNNCKEEMCIRDRLSLVADLP